MSKRNKLLIIISLVVIVTGLIIFLIFTPEKGTNSKTDTTTNSSDITSSVPKNEQNRNDSSSKDTENTVNSDIFTPGSPTIPIDDNLPPNVEIKPQPQTEGDKGSIVFPYTIEGYNLVIEKLSGFDGIYVEDGTNNEVKGVAAMLVSNDGDYPIEYSEISVEYEGETLNFTISALDKGETAMIQEKNKKAVPQGKALKGNALIVRKADMPMSQNTVKVTDNGDNSLTVENLTDKPLTTVRIFYKYYMEEEKIFVGGIAFTSGISRLPAKGKTVIRPAHFASKTGRVVMVTFDE